MDWAKNLLNMVFNGMSENMRLKMLDMALREYELREIPGVEHNPRILHYFQTIGQEWVQTDETAWCSAFINFICVQSGIRGTGELNARSWLKWGEETDLPLPGHVVVFWRESRKSWKGHVGLYIRERDGKIWTLGGNQNNKVEISPYAVDRVLSVRRFS